LQNSPVHYDFINNVREQEVFDLRFEGIIVPRMPKAYWSYGALYHGYPFQTLRSEIFHRAGLFKGRHPQRRPVAS
jgi:hypothetical protein